MMVTGAPGRVRDRVDCCFSLGRLLLLTVTDACNQRCIHCFRDALPRKTPLLEMHRLGPALTTAVAELRLDRVVISGGEPTLVVNLGDLIAHIAGLGVRASLATNATRIDDDRARSLAAAGLATATVGIDGIGADYTWFRGTASGYERALAGIEALIQAGVGVTVNVTVHDRIIHQATQIAGELSGRGLRSISVTAPIAAGRLTANPDAFTLIDRLSVECFADVLAGAADCPVSLRMPRCDSGSCPSGRSAFSMDRDGVLSNCPDEGAVNVCDAHREYRQLLGARA